MKTFTTLRKNATTNINSNKNTSLQLEATLQVEQIAKKLENIHRRKSINNHNLITSSRHSLNFDKADTPNLIREEDQLDNIFKDPQSFQPHDKSTVVDKILVTKDDEEFTIVKTNKTNNQVRKYQQPKSQRSKQYNTRDLCGILDNKVKPIKMISKPEKEKIVKNIHQIFEMVQNTQIATDNLNQIQATINTLKSLIKK